MSPKSLRWLLGCFCIHTVSGLAAPIQTTPFSLQSIAPELSGDSWWRFLGIGLNLAAQPQLRSGKLTFGINEWYITGKGTPLLKADLSSTQEVQFGTGVLGITSVPNDRATLTKDKNKLQLNYRLAMPVSRGAGVAYIAVSGNAPMPAVVPGDHLRLSFWVRGDLKARKENLAQTGTATVFGGDIFSEFPLRLGLSYGTSRVYGVPSYRIVAGKQEVIYSAERNSDMQTTYANHERVHSADSPRGLASRTGFIVSPTWSQVTTQRFTIAVWDIGTKVASFEILLQLPYDPSSAVGSPAQWENLSGTYELTGFHWFKEQDRP